MDIPGLFKKYFIEIGAAKIFRLVIVKIPFYRIVSGVSQWEEMKISEKDERK